MGEEDTAAAEPNKEVEGLKSALMAERGKRQSETSARQAAELRAAKAEGVAEGMGETRDQREVTRGELNEQVSNGRMTQDEMDLVLDRQSDERATRIARETAQKTVSDDTLTNKVNAEIDRYKAQIPDIVVDGSDARAKVTAEFNFLVSNGNPSDSRTELAALRAAFGPAERLVQGETQRETHQETGSDADTGSETRTDGSPKGLTARERDFYRERIGPGKLYTDWKAVEAELKHATPALRKRMGAS